MLTQLVVENLGLIESARLEFDGGLRVVTGETGVGKSLLLRSLSLLGGARARVDWIRTGADEARVSGYFIPQRSPAIETIDELTGIRCDAEEGNLIERVLRRSGRHRTLINSREVPLSLLQQVGSQLLEIHGQHAQLSLTEPAQQLLALDRFAGLGEAREKFRALYREGRALGESIDSLEAQARERHDRRLFLEHIVSDLEAAELQVGEREQLERDLQLLEEGDRLSQLVQGLLHRLYEGESSIIDTLADCEREVAPFGELHTGLKEFVEAVSQARVGLDEGVRSLQGVTEDLSADPARLDEQRQRMDRIVQLEERFRRSGDELLSYLEETRQELNELAGDAERLPELQASLDGIERKLATQARALTKKRTQAATQLGKKVATELADLGMNRVQFGLSLQPIGKKGWDRFSETGGDRAEFLFGPNPGEPPRPLRSVASGGELSRVMLSLKRVLADADAVGTLVFDEIDAGVGGRLGMELGRKLRQIGETHQVFCVTHLPQVAACALSHYQVTKEVLRKRTTTIVAPLAPDRRVREIATMIHGEEHSETAVRQAEEMIVEGSR